MRWAAVAEDIEFFAAVVVAAVNRIDSAGSAIAIAAPVDPYYWFSNVLHSDVQRGSTI